MVLDPFGGKTVEDEEETFSGVCAALYFYSTVGREVAWVEGSGNIRHRSRAGVRGVAGVQQRGVGCYRLFRGRNYSGESADLGTSGRRALKELGFMGTKIK